LIQRSADDKKRKARGSNPGLLIGQRSADAWPMA